MWAKVESDSVTSLYIRPTAITVGDVNYPQNIMSMWSASELEAIGIYSVDQDDSNLNSQEKIINNKEDKPDLINIAADHQTNNDNKIPELDTNSTTLETANTNSDINNSNIDDNS